MRPNLLWLLAVVSITVSAQTSDDTDDPSYVYQVEAIVFRYANAPGLPTRDVRARDAEAIDLWPEPVVLDNAAATAPRSTAQTDNVVSESDAGDAPSEVDEADSEMPFRPTNIEALTLTDMATRLSSNDRYEVLLHRGWQQPAVDFGSPQPVRLRGGSVLDVDSDEPEPTYTDGAFGSVMDDDEEALESEPPLFELDGWLSFTIGRFNHLTVDIELRQLVQAPKTDGSDEMDDQPSAMPGMPPKRPSEPERYQDFFEIEMPTLQPNAWVVKDRRRTGFDELQYFDSEHFGIIARARRIELPPVPTELEN